MPHHTLVDSTLWSFHTTPYHLYVWCYNSYRIQQVTHTDTKTPPEMPRTPGQYVDARAKPISVLKHVCVYIYIYVISTCVYIYIYIYIYVLYVHLSLTMSLSLSLYIYIYIYVWTYSGYHRVWLKQNLDSTGWNYCVHREFPGMFESSNLSRDKLSIRCMYVCMYVCMHACVYIYIYIYMLCVYVYVYVCMYVYM